MTDEQTAAAHTPGPWEIRKTSDTTAYIESTVPSRKVQRWRRANPDKKQDAFGRVSICRSAININGSGDPFGPTDGLIDREEWEANLLLKAAAPHLLAACEYLLAVVEMRLRATDDPNHPDLKRARAAIAEARKGLHHDR